MIITISDNGTGIYEHQRSSNLEKNKSLGMRITQKRLALLQSYAREKVIEIEEIKNFAGIAIGTRIKLKVSTGVRD